MKKIMNPVMKMTKRKTDFKLILMATIVTDISVQLLRLVTLQMITCLMCFTNLSDISETKQAVHCYLYDAI